MYLSLPSVASQALSAVLSSVGPSTAVRYLNFACGKGIGPASLDELEGAVGLESLARPVSEDTASHFGTSTGVATPAISINKPDVPEPDAFEQAFEKLDLHKKGSLRTPPIQNAEPVYDYGNISNKVGEAVTCWLTRWCGDLVATEMQAHGGAVPASVSGLEPSTTTRPRSYTDATDDRSLLPVLTNVPKIFSDSGLSTKWVCAVLAADSLFVKGEKERYNLAKKVFELRHIDGAFTLEDENDWAQFFHHSIYYPNIVRDACQSDSSY